LILVAWRSHPTLPLIVAANRDEFHSRSSVPLHRWSDAPIVAGRDAFAGGTWLAVRHDGAFAAVTNIREPGAPVGTRSRGDLPLAVLNAPSIAIGVAHAVANGGLFSGFHIIAADHEGLWHASNRGEGPTRLPPGLYGISNGRRDAGWPKVVGGVDALRQVLDDPAPHRLIALLRDRTTPPDDALPDTGVGLEMERGLAPRFIDLPGYGTRVSTVVLRSSAEIRVVERTWDDGGGEQDERWALPPLSAGASG